MNYFNDLKNKITTKKLKIGVIGIGTIGKSLINNLIETGYNVHAYDVNKDVKKKIKKLKKLKIFISKYESVKELDVIIFCLPTHYDFKPNLKSIHLCLDSIKKLLKEGQILIIESSVLPGTCLSLTKKLSNFKIGNNFFFGYSPERYDPGNKKYNIKNTTRIISGQTENCRNLTNLFYKSFIKKTIEAQSIKHAEFTKLYENVYRGININFVNEMAILAEKSNISIKEIIKLASSKPFGFEPFYPGIKIGGSCILNNMKYLNWYSNKNKAKTLQLSAILKSITYQNKFLIKKVKKFLNSNKAKKILIIGLSYKKNCNDHRNSLAEDIIKFIKIEKIQYDFHDKYFKKFDGKKSLEINQKNISKFNSIIVCCAHDYLKKYLQIFKKNSSKILDVKGDLIL